MYCDESPHDIAFVKGPDGKLHHFAYHIDEWSALLRAGGCTGWRDPRAAASQARLSTEPRSAMLLP